MLVSTFFPIEAINVRLPESVRSERVPMARAPLIVTITEEDEIFIDGRKVSWSDFKSELENRLMLYPERKILVKADRFVKLQTIVRLFDVLKEKGIKTINLLTTEVKKK